MRTREKLRLREQEIRRIVMLHRERRQILEKKRMKARKHEWERDLAEAS